MIKRQSGQAILALILIMTVALAIGLSVVQKSLVDVSTSTMVEESSRAFSAAEAGIEKALKGDYSGVNFTENNSSATIPDTGKIPAIPAANTRQDPLEYPPLAKEEVAHIWLADPDADLPNCTKKGNPATCYTQNSLDVYWGNSPTDKAALELTIVYYEANQYKSKKWYLEQDVSRQLKNAFTLGCDSNSNPALSNYTCKYTLTSLPTGLMLIRARLLYNTTSQPFAVQAVGVGAGHYIPPQARVFRSTGISGETQRKVQVLQEPKVVPSYFDYAIFSLGDIRK